MITPMRRRWLLVFALVLAPLMAQAQQGGDPQASMPARDPELVAVEQLKSEACRALKGGQFDRTSELLARAASMSKDPALTQMSDWIHQFQSQRHEYVTERAKAFDKAVADIKTLQNAS